MALNRRDFLKTAVAGIGVAGTVNVAKALERAPKTLPSKAVGMLYDATLCIGCKACMAACKEANHMPPEHAGRSEVMWDTPLDLSGKTLSIIKLYQDSAMEQKDREQNGYAFVKRHCLHCVDPSCVSVCPVSAMTKDPVTGIVEHHPDRCIGCRYCVFGCPFGVPKYEYDNPFGQIQKCQFCSHLQAKGQLPACCDVCPTGASLFGTVEDLKAEAKRRLALQAGETYLFPRGRLGGDRPPNEGKIAHYQKHLYGEKELGGTQVMVLSAVPFDKLGLPTHVPDTGYPAVSEGIQHTLYKGMALPLAVLAGLVFLVRRTTDEAENSMSKTNKSDKDRS